MTARLFCVLLGAAHTVVASTPAFAEGSRPREAAEADVKVGSAALKSRLVGRWPSPTRKISLDQQKGTVADALRSIARQVGWDLMMSAPLDTIQHPIALQVKNRPAAMVLDLVLMQSGLQAELKENLLLVTPFKGPAADQKDDGWASFKEAKCAGTDKTRPSRTRENRSMADDSIGKSPDSSDRDEPGGEGRSRRRRRKQDRVVVGSSLVIEKGEEVESAVAIGGSVKVAGLVRDEAVAIGGSVIVEPTGLVKGDAVALGGKIEVKPGGDVSGDRVAIGGSFKGVVSFISSMAAGSVGWFLYSVTGTIVRSVLLFLLALMLLTFIPDRMENVRSYMSRRPGASVLGGVGILLAFIPMCVLLAVTIIGLVAIPFAVVGLLVLHVMGLTAFMTWLGHKIPLSEKGKTPVFAMFLGLLVITLIGLIPIVGSIIIAAIAFVSAGAVLLSHLGKPSKAEASKALAT